MARKSTKQGCDKAIKALKMSQADILQAMRVCIDRTIGEFINNHFSGGKRYKALDPDYAKQKKRKYGNKPILVASGDLKRSALSNKKVTNSLDNTGIDVSINVTEYGDYVLELRDYLSLTQQEIDYLSQMIEEKLSQYQLVRQQGNNP